MLKTIRKRKHLCFFLMTFSILFGGLVVGGPVLADEGAEEPEPEQTTTEEPEIEEPETEEPDEDGDGISDTAEELLDRNVVVVQVGDRVKIESERKASPKDEFKTELVEDEGLRIKYEYRSEAGSVINDVELVIQFTQLIAYNADGDPIGEAYPLEGFKFDILELGSSDDGKNKYEITATNADDVFLVRVFASEGFAIINGEPVDPTVLKIDIEIHNFNYTDDTNILALETILETSASVTNITDDEDNLVGLSATIGEYSVDYTWISTAIVDNDELPVGADIFKEEYGEENFELKFNMLYPVGQDIVHDPKLGAPLSSLSYAQGIQVFVPEKLKGIIPHISIGTYFFGSLMATLLVISVPVISRRRKR